MKKTTLKAKDALKLLAAYSLELSKKDTFQRIEAQFDLLAVNGKVAFFKHQETYLPALKFLLQHRDLLKTITVDMGAVRFVAKGADIMRPGITQIDPGIKENEFVTIIDENNKTPLAVGQALLNAQEMQTQQKGKVIKTIHYVGDELWKLEL